MELHAHLMNEDEMKRALKRLSLSIVEGNDGTEGLVLLGIKRRGVPLAELMAEQIKLMTGTEILVGELDITFYRDDIADKRSDFAKSLIPCSLEKKNVVLVDDVLYTGRTVRAAMDAVMDFGRPYTVKLAVLIDRGHRELPIRANYVGKNIPTADDEFVKVHTERYDGCYGVDLYWRDR